MTYPAGMRHHSKLPHDAEIHTRQPERVQVPDKDMPVEQYIAVGLAMLASKQEEFARRVDNRAHIVDEYQTETIVGDSQTTITLQATYDFMPEKIESIIINGPASASFTLQLGDRFWSMVMPASGILTIGYVAVLLGRNDPRILTASTSGDWFFELMGVADQRFTI